MPKSCRKPSARVFACAALASLSLGAVAIGDPVRRYVDADAAGTSSGTSWTNAFPSLAECLEALAGVLEPPEDGWEIWVAEGTYLPDPVVATFPVPENHFLYGGFNGAETQRQQRDPLDHETVLSGEMSGAADLPCGVPEAGGCLDEHAEAGCEDAPCCMAVCSIVPSCCVDDWDETCVEVAESLNVCIERATNAPSVVSATDMALTRRVDGFTITRGGSFDADEQESGIYGAGVRITNGSLQLVRCLVTDNRAQNGGGVSLDNQDEEIEADVQIWNCRINENVSTVHGAGFHALGRVTYTVANSEICNNSAIYEPTPPAAFQLGLGGGVFEAVTEDDYERAIVNCTIVRNRASIGSQGVYQNQLVPLHDEDLSIRNSIVRNNYAQITLLGEFEECDEPCEVPEIVGGAEVIGCLVAFDPGSPPANFEDCINDVPGLVAIDGDDYRLDDGSACIDAARTDVVVDDEFDANDNGVTATEVAPELFLHRRIQPAPGASTPVVDIGAHEFPNCDCSVGDFNDDESVDGADLGELLSAWGTCTSPCPPDLNGDGVADGADLGVLLAAWCGDADYPRVCGESLLGGGGEGAMMAEGAGGGVSLVELAAIAGFSCAGSFVAWLSELPEEEISAWLDLLSD